MAEQKKAGIAGGVAALTRSFRITSAVVWNVLLIFFILLLVMAAFAGGAGAGYFASLVQEEEVHEPDELELAIYDYEEATEIYFDDEEYLGDLPSPLERREIPLDDMSENLINAVIATEDEYFFEHEGIVPKALMRAVMQDFSGGDTQTGGSTLTQQLVKNQLLSSEVTHDRKAAEILLAMRVEQFFDKEDILEAYLNVVPFGRNASGQQVAGAQAAAQGIFGVDASELNIPQAAFIAGLPQSPFGHTPFEVDGSVKESFDSGINRMATVLDRMHRMDYIDDEELEAAENYDLEASFAEPETTSYDDYPFILRTVENRSRDKVAEYLMEEDDVFLDEIDDPEQELLLLNRYREDAEEALQRNGYRIHTSIDKDIYDAQQEAVENFEHFGPNKTVSQETEDGEWVDVEYEEQTGSVLIDNRTGAVKSFVASRDFEISEVNHAMTLSYAGGFRRNTGSTMKSLLTYGLGFESGELQPAYLTPDIPYIYESTRDDDEPREVTNFDLNNQGMMTAREAHASSRNVPAVREMSRMDQEYILDGLRDYGFERFFPDDSSFPFESTALGTIGMTVEANTSAFSSFGNEGSKKESYMIERIETADGDVIFEQDHDVETDILSTQTNYLMIDMMRDVLDSDMGTAGSLPGRMNFDSDLAGKTGTTNDIVDSWFVGLNPNFTQGIWVGYGTQEVSVEQSVNGMNYGPRTQQLWADLANAAHSVDPSFMEPEDSFEQPDGIVEATVCGISGQLPSDLCEEAGMVTTDLFNEEHVPTETDDTLERVDYVRVNGDFYLALDSTPSEFTRSGVSISDEFFNLEDDEDLSEYIPDDWDNLISTEEEAPDNGRTPGAPSNVFGGTSSMGWGAHPEGDVVGYRVYQAPDENSSFTHVDSLRWDEDYTYSGGTAAYYVTAVDASGRESSRSSVVTIGNPGASTSSTNDGGGTGSTGDTGGGGTDSGTNTGGGANNTSGGGNNGADSGANNAGGGNNGADNSPNDAGGGNNGADNGANNTGGGNNGADNGANNAGGGNNGADNSPNNAGGGNNGADNGANNAGGGNNGADNGANNAGGGNNGADNGGANDSNANTNDAGNNDAEAATNDVDSETETNNSSVNNEEETSNNTE
ncbi:transglycosylase domain-containing protein [Alkalicoccus chagannorensis]|uniref:transglycosylase domain-containing protein n=1 Tax=Alkalicoccus chagannorensis TaxID=427072 RepID=UPI000428CDE9|nr:transglycosylase domain-containing protein [Alkalicoccus chagannorensis]